MSLEVLEIFKRGTKTLNILQDENRQTILILLCRNQQLTVNQITEQLSISRPAVSHHLRLMLEAGLLSVKQIGVERYYTSEIEDTLEWLKELTHSLEETIKRSEKN